MTKKQVAFARKKLQLYFKKWEWLVTHYGWKFDVFYCDNYHDMPRSAGEDTAMITYAKFRYLKGEIYVNLEICAKEDKEALEEMTVHELTHMLLSPIEEDAPVDQMEYTTTTISRIFLGTFQSRGE